jgi:type I restriction enzyme, R subunit
MFEQAFRNIDDVLRKEAGCTTELDYTEQTSWLLFLKYLDGLEEDKATEAELNGKKYSYILDKSYRWEAWAAPKGKDGKLDHNKALTGDDLRDFVNGKLFPYLHGFKQRATGPDTIEYKIGEIFGEIKNKIQSGYNLREIIDHIDELRFRSQTEKHELSHLYEAKIKNMGNAGRRRGRVPTNGSLFFTIFQTFMSGPEKDGKPSPYFGEYPPDFFDFIVIDECHRGGANDESNWRGIMDYFAPAVQLGLTATPKRDENVDTYRYFGEPVYIYSLKEGINDGFLTPFKVKQIQTTMDYYIYTPDDTVVEGEIEAGKLYDEPDFNRNIEIREREKKRVEIFLSQINQNEKTLVFCANQAHALLVRDLINQLKTSKDPNYCQRVTADDGALGEQYLRDFQDNEKTIPTILTTSQKLSTGVDARNIRNIVLMRPIKSMIEFKQIIGRGTRLYEGKDYFTIYDFVKAHLYFNDPEWDGEPIDPDPKEPRPPGPPKPREPGPEPPPRPKKIKVKLADGKERNIQHMMATTFWHPDGTPMSAQQFMTMLFGNLPDFFQSEEELRKLWSAPDTRAKLLQGLAEKGFGHQQLAEMQKIIDAEKSDLFDVLAFVAYALPPVTREVRADHARVYINSNFTAKQQAFSILFYHIM